MEATRPPAPTTGHQPRRIQLSRKRGWRIPKGAIKVDRTTMFGNPFKVGGPNLLGWGTVRDAEHAVWLHRQWLVTPSRSIAVELTRHDGVLRALPNLAGHDLACWCAVDAHHCHANTLLELANRPHIAAEVAALLDAGDDVPWSPVERSIALVQLARLLDLTAAQVTEFGTDVTAAAAQIRAARAAEADRD